MTHRLDKFNFLQLFDMWKKVIAEKDRINKLGGNVNDIEWDRLDALDIEQDAIKAALDLLYNITYGEARRLRPTLKNDS